MATAVALPAVALLAMVTGLAAAVGLALVTPQPAVFLAAGLLTTALVGGGGFWLVLRSRRPRPRMLGTLSGVFTLVLVTALAILAPPTVRQPGPPPLAGVAYWDLSTGSRIAFVTLAASSGPRRNPIVVLHGGPGIPDMAGDAAFFGQLTGLGFTIYVYDQLGSGRSARLADPIGYGVGRDVADLEQIRRAIDAQRMILIGHSYGGVLAAHYLAAHPTRVEALILSSPGALDPSDHSADRAPARLDAGARLRTFAAALTPRAVLGYSLLQVSAAAAHAYLGDAEADARNDTILTLAEPGLHCSPDQRAGQVRGSGFYALQYPQSRTAPPQPDVRATLSGLLTPTLILKGSCDYLSWRSAADYRRVLPHATLLYLEGAGHNTYQDRPAEVLAAIRAFLTGSTLPQPPYEAGDAPEGYQGPR